jgi:CheY-like chemotaxis protein
MREKWTNKKGESMRDEKIQQGKRILVVEDHPESLELLQMMLEEEGYHVQSAETGHNAIKAVTSPPADESPDPPPDLILLDLRLPDMNGVDVVRALQENLSEVPPVVFLSADPPHTLKEAARSVGASSVRKPFEFDELFKVIKRALNSVILIGQ